ncbi:MAG: BON domain-containing protein, partial [Planctomycetia bacterium]
MPISRTAFVAAVIVSLATTSVSADDLAASVAAKMKESGTLKGYRVNVKAKAGTVWLEGTVSDARQIDAAIAAAEEVAGVERIVNRLSVQGSSPTNDTFALPASIRSLVGLPTMAAEPEAEPAAAADAPSAERAVLEDRDGAEGDEQSQIALTQAVGGAPARQPAAAGKPVRREAQPRPFGGRAAKPVPQARRSGGAVQRTAMKSQIQGMPLDLPAAEGGYIGENAFVEGSYPAQGGVGDGQMVPGSMRFTEGPAGGYCPPGQGGMGGPMPMGAGMR